MSCHAEDFDVYAKLLLLLRLRLRLLLDVRALDGRVPAMMRATYPRDGCRR